ncbi:hypothetical protein ACFL3H_03385, partial [Gemmatimonadota bacterium]
QGALGGRNIGESLGEFIQVSVRLESDGTPEDLSLLSLYGVPGQFIGPITTLIIERIDARHNPLRISRSGRVRNSQQCDR